MVIPQHLLPQIPAIRGHWGRRAQDVTVHTSTSMGTRVDGFHYCLSFAVVEGLGRKVVAEQEESSRFWWN